MTQKIEFTAFARAIAIIAWSLFMIATLPVFGQEDKPDTSATTSKIDQLTKEERAALQAAIHRITFPRNREVGLTKQIALVNEYAPLETPQIYEAHLCLAKFELARADATNFRGRIDPAYIQQQLEHCLTLRPDDPESILLLSDCYAKAYRQARYSRQPEIVESAPELLDKAYQLSVGKLATVVWAMKKEGELDEAFKDKAQRRITDEVEKGVITEALSSAIDVLGRPDSESGASGLGRPIIACELYQRFHDNLMKTPDTKRPRQSFHHKVQSGLRKHLAVAMMHDYKENHDNEQLLDSIEKIAGDSSYLPENIKIAITKMILAGESVERAKAIYDPFHFNEATRRSRRAQNAKYVRVPIDVRKLIADAYSEKGDFDTAIIWVGPAYGRMTSTELAKWGMMVLKSENGDTERALEAFARQLELNLIHNLNHHGSEKDQVDDLFFKAHGLLLARGGRFTEATDPLKYYLSRFPDDEESKNELKNCLMQVRKELDELDLPDKESQE